MIAGLASAQSVDTAYATLRESKEVAVPSENAAVIGSLLVKIGDSVSQGQRIGALRTERQLLEIAQLEAEAEELRIQSRNAAPKRRAEAIIEEKSFELEQLKELAKRFDTAELERKRVRSELQQAKADADGAADDQAAARAGLKAKLAELDASRYRLERSTLLAPFDGVVTEIILSEGEWAKEGDPILKIMRLDELELVLTVPYASVSPNTILGRRLPVVFLDPLGRPIYSTEFQVERLQPETDTSGYFLAFSAIKNERTRGDGATWRLVPGLSGEADLTSLLESGSEPDP